MFSGLLVVVALAVSSWALAQPVLRRPVPKRHWGTAERVWLARCWVAEAGFAAPDDWAAIGWVLARRWKMYRAESGRDVPFKKFIRMYSAPLRGAPYTKRQMWLMQLNDELVKPADWPTNVDWSVHRRYWAEVLDYVDRWARGDVADPSGGRALHWGGKTDAPLRGWYPLDLGTENTFYTPMPRREDS